MKLSFESQLERLAKEINYFALPVPAEVTAALKTTGPVPVSARVNGSKPFLVSLYPRGEGRHGMRIKAEVREEVKIEEGDRVSVEIAVIDREAEIEIPDDLAKALRTADALEAFKALPKGKQRYTLRWISEVAKPETRAKRIQSVVSEAQVSAAKAKPKAAQKKSKKTEEKAAAKVIAKRGTARLK